MNDNVHLYKQIQVAMCSNVNDMHSEIERYDSHACYLIPIVM